MQEEFGVIDVTRMAEDVTYEPYEYIILARQSGSNWASLICGRCDQAMLDLKADYTLIVLRRDPGSK